MNATPLPPEHAWLHDFLLGRLDDEQQEHAEARLRRSPELLPLLQQLAEATPLLEGVPGRMLPQSPADSTDLSDLVQRLQRLRPADDTGQPAFADTLSPDPGQTGPAIPPVELAFLAPPQEPDELGRLGGFRILEVLGAGGMGMVLRAEDTTIRRAVAMKVMKPGIAAQAGARDRFLREARLASGLDHENVATIHHVGEDRGVPFFTMPLLAGETLESRLQRDRVLPVDEVLRIGREAAEGLAAAHASGLIHRDIKPGNLWLFRRPDEPGTSATGGRVKLLDFGLARPLDDEVQLTRPDQLMGTPAYMSPEQVQNGAVGPASDLFSLGSVLYRAATGQAPFTGKHLMELLQNVSSSMPRPPHEVRPDAPRTLSAFIMRLLEKDPAKRPASARAVVEEIDRILYQATTTPAVAAGLQPADSGIEARSASEGTEARSASEGTSESAGYKPAATGRRWLVAAVTLFAGLLAAAWLAWAGRKGNGGDDPTKAPPAEAGRVKYSGRVDMIVWSKDGQDVRKLRLREPGALPLHRGDTVRIAASVKPAAYLYLFWIGTDGEAKPVYPWKPGKWGTRPAAEEKREELQLPVAASKGLKLLDNTEGMETVVLLAFAEPLGAGDDEVKQWFAGLGEQQPVQNRFAAVWFENGHEVKGDPGRERSSFEVTDINDPVLRVQELLRERLGKRAAFTAAVSFARERR